MPLALLPFALLVVPVLEIAVFVIVGQRIGLLPTLAMVVVTAAIGTLLLRHQGFRVFERLKAELDAGRMPGRALGDGAMILAAGLLLLTPGFVTDTLGFLLFVPAVRSRIWQFLSSRFTVVVAGQGFRGPAGPHDPRGNGRRVREDGVIDLDPDDYTSADAQERP